MLSNLYYDLLNDLILKIEELEAQKASISQRIEDLKTTVNVINDNICDNEEDNISIFYEEYFIEE